jgi:hypothetical protein
MVITEAIITLGIIEKRLGINRAKAIIDNETKTSPWQPEEQISVAGHLKATCTNDSFVQRTVADDYDIFVCKDDPVELDQLGHLIRSYLD